MMSDTGNLVRARPWIKNYDLHVPKHLDYPPLSINDLFYNTVLDYKQKDFLIFNDSRYSYEEIGKLVETASDNLISRGVRKGDRIALILPNIPQFVIAYFAILRVGGIVVAMNPNYKKPEFQHIFKDIQPSGIICLYHQIGLIREITVDQALNFIFAVKPDENLQIQQPDSRKMEVDNQDEADFWDLFQKQSARSEYDINHILPGDPAIFQYSGGTTGIPKAAVGLHKNIVSNAIQFAHWCDLSMGREVILAVIPLYHVYGMVLAMNLALWVGASIVLVDDPKDVEKILNRIEVHKVTFYPGVPAMYYAINQNHRVRDGKVDMSSIKACISGSAPLHSKIKEEFEKYTGGKLIEGYGLSEAPTATHCNPLYGNNRTGSIGMPLPDVDCKIVNLEDGTTDLPQGKIGELILKGPQVMKGYHDQPKENQKALRDGWLYTGDVAWMDSDGYFYIVDRKKSLIKIGGFQVWPNEIEAVINSHPHIVECAVGGVPDMKHGEKVIAWVVKEANKDVPTSEVKALCEENLASYKLPSEVIFIEKVPRTGVGKILRRELISEYIKKK